MTRLRKATARQANDEARRKSEAPSLGASRRAGERVSRRKVSGSPVRPFTVSDFLPSDFGLPPARRGGGFLLSLPGDICYGKGVVRRYCLIFGLILCGWLAATARGDTFQLTTGESVTGEALISSANDDGVQIKVGEGDYKRVPWASFSQDDLKKFAQTPKLQPLVDPFIEISAEEKAKKTEVTVKPPPRFERPAPQSLVGALFSSAPGLFLVLVVYAATIYAGYEVAIFRAQPIPLVCGLAAVPVLGVLSPIIFLSRPTKMAPRAGVEEIPVAEPSAETAAAGAPGAAAAPAAGGADADNPMAVAGAEHPAGLKLAHTEEPAKPALPPTTTFQRGQYTFNRRFIETKFSGFFAVVRRDADKDMVLVIKSARGEFIGQRISRIASNDMHLEVHRGHASEEVVIPFVEIQEIRLKHKDA